METEALPTTLLSPERVLRRRHKDFVDVYVIPQMRTQNKKGRKRRNRACIRRQCVREKGTGQAVLLSSSSCSHRQRLPDRCRFVPKPCNQRRLRGESCGHLLERGHGVASLEQPYEVCLREVVQTPFPPEPPLCVLVVHATNERHGCIRRLHYMAR